MEESWNSDSYFGTQLFVSTCQGVNDLTNIVQISLNIFFLEKKFGVCFFTYKKTTAQGELSVETLRRFFSLRICHGWYGFGLFGT